MTLDDDLLVSLRGAARRLAARGNTHNLHDTLAQIVLLAVQTVPHVDGCGISLAEGGIITSQSPSHKRIGELDRLQVQLREGPSMTALLDPPGDGIVIAHDLAHNDGPRWPRFALEAVLAGYRSVLSTQMATGGAMGVVLNLYSHEPNVFDKEVCQVIDLYGMQAAILLSGSEQANHLHRTVDSPDLIGQAKGILMERYTVDDARAFHMLVTSSLEADVKLVDVAQWLRSEARHRHAESVAMPDHDPHDAAHERAQQRAERAPWG